MALPFAMIKGFPSTRLAKARLLALIALMFYCAFLFILEPFYWTLKYQPQVGDIIAQALPKGELTKLIEGATNSKYSHVGIIRKEQGSFVVYEAIVDVHSTSLFKWIRRGRGNKFAVFRLKDEFVKHIPAVEKHLDGYRGQPYDFKYDFDDIFIYCSELIFKSYLSATGDSLGQTKVLSELNWQPYTETIKKLNEGDVPLDRRIITPVDMTKSPNLIKVFDNGL